MQKNVAGQKWIVFAFGGPGHAQEGLPITGDAANITANLRQDAGAAAAVADTNPAELEGGAYAFDLAQAETNADLLSIHPVSATPDVLVIGVPGALWTTPAGYPSLGIAAGAVSADAKKINGETVIGTGTALDKWRGA